jgi:hypothetical protein
MFVKTADHITNTNSSTLLSNVFQDAGANVTLSDFNGNAVVAFNGNNITLTGVTSGMLSPADFLFPPGSTIGLEHQHVTG